MQRTAHHDWGEWKTTTPADCTQQKATKSDSVTVWFRRETRTLAKTDAAVERMEKTTPADCTTEGEEVRQCNTCGFSKRQELLAKTDHDWAGEDHNTNKLCHRRQKRPDSARTVRRLSQGPWPRQITPVGEWKTTTAPS